MHRFLSVLLAVALLVPGAAYAHTGAGATHGLVHGFLHPIGGLDHLLAMVTVGAFAWQLGGRARWLVPASFVAVMSFAGALGMAGIAVPHVEIGIALSVAALGAAVALAIRTPTAAAMALVAVFAVFHGHAHGAEMPADAAALSYAAGFVVATALLHAVGLGMALAIHRAGDRVGGLAVRAAGGAVALAGFAVLADVM